VKGPSGNIVFHARTTNTVIGPHDNLWDHIALTVDTTHRYAYIYHNGVRVRSIGAAFVSEGHPDTDVMPPATTTRTGQHHMLGHDGTYAGMVSGTTW
jgi:hypothetical protein